MIWGGRYAIYDELASGGMATIYMATRLGGDPTVPLVVALKKLAEQFAKQPEFVAMFLDEAHLAARVRHPNVVTTYEFLRTDEGLGIVMELVVGESLMQLGRGHHPGEDSPPPLPVTLAIVTGALDGLHAAHQITDDSGRPINVVHRDVSPHNIIVGADGLARVIDFGIAKAKGRLQTTDVGVLKGKFAYMSPEQIRGKSVDRRTDVYSTGIVLWESLAGRKMFRARTNEDLLTERTSGTVVIPPPSSVNPAVPKELDAIVLRALSTDPSERFGSALAMAETIRAQSEVADEATVAAWVKSRAGARLAALEEKRRRLEVELAAGSPPSGPYGAASRGAPSRPPRRDSLIASVGSRSHPPVAPIVDVPDEVPAVPRAAKSPEVDIPMELDVPAPAPGSRGRFSGDLDLDPGGASQGATPPLPLELASDSLVAAMHSAPAVLEPRLSPERSRPVAAPRRERSYHGGAFLMLFVLVAALGAVGLLEGPALLRARVVAAATAHGLVISVERAELSHDGVALSGLRGSLTGCPSIHVAAAEADVALDRSGGVESVTLPAYELTVTGTAAEVAAELAAWRQTKAAPLPLQGKAGHLLWTARAIPTLVVEALDVALTVSAGPERAIMLDSPGLLLNLPRTHVGPWRLHIDSSAAATRVRIGFDPSAADGPPSATLLDRPREATTWNVDIPRASTFKAGIPTELFGISSDLAMEVSLHGDLSPTGDALSADGEVGLYGLEISSGHGGAVPVDLIVSGSLHGDPGKPLAIAGGKLSVGKGVSPVGGIVVLKPDGLRVEIERPSGHPSASPALTLDTREWTAAVKGTGTAAGAPGR